MGQVPPAVEQRQADVLAPRSTLDSGSWAWEVQCEIKQSRAQDRRLTPPVMKLPFLPLLMPRYLQLSVSMGSTGVCNT